MEHFKHGQVFTIPPADIVLPIFCALASELSLERDIPLDSTELSFITQLHLLGIPRTEIDILYSVFQGTKPRAKTIYQLYRYYIYCYFNVFAPRLFVIK
jgi:hypothetical protein